MNIPHELVLRRLVHEEGRYFRDMMEQHFALLRSIGFETPDRRETTGFLEQFYQRMGNYPLTASEIIFLDNFILYAVTFQSLRKMAVALVHEAEVMGIGV